MRKCGYIRAVCSEHYQHFYLVSKISKRVLELEPVNLTFRSNPENLLTVIKEFAVAWILCGRLHA